MKLIDVTISLVPETAYSALRGDPEAHEVILERSLESLAQRDLTVPTYYPEPTFPKQPEITRDGRLLTIKGEYGPEDGITFTALFPSEEWAAKVEARLRRDLDHVDSYMDDGPTRSLRYGKIVQQLIAFIRFYTVDVKWQFDGVKEAFGVVDA